jgi:ABC-2 type transport system ATP-binding protein
LKPLLEIRNLAKRYGRLTAVEQVSFSVREGEILGLIGPNGAGKTTVFECLGGTLPADQLQVSRHGEPLALRDLRSIIFYLPDGITPWPAQKAGWALDYIVGLFGGRAGLRQDVERRLDLAPLLDRPMSKLSKGQRKRVLLALGLLAPQPVLIADEPFEGLDLRQTRDVAAALRCHAGEGKRTMVLSIHQIADAARVCDRFVLLSGGKLCGEGTLPELSAMAAARGGALASAAGLEEVFLALT